MSEWRLGIAVALMVVASTSCTTSPARVRTPPASPDTSQLYEDFGDFRMRSTYPRAAVEVGQEGWVLLEFSVDTDGCVSEVTVVDASPPGYFEEAATAPFIDHCFSHPKIVDGMPVESLNRPFFMSYQLED